MIGMEFHLDGYCLSETVHEIRLGAGEDDVRYMLTGYGHGNSSKSRRSTLNMLTITFELDYPDSVTRLANTFDYSDIHNIEIITTTTGECTRGFGYLKTRHALHSGWSGKIEWLFEMTNMERIYRLEPKIRVAFDEALRLAKEI